MPEIIKNNATKKATPGLASVNEKPTSDVHVTDIGRRKRDDNTSTTKKPPVAAVKTTVTKPTPQQKPLVKPKALQPVTKSVTTTRTTAPKSTKSSFKIGGTNYHIIDDNRTSRKMIKWDSDGNIASDSPVQMIGKNINGGFILAASDDVKGTKHSSFPMTDGAINFPNLKSDKSGSPSKLQNMHFKTYKDASEVSDSDAASELRGMYIRTKQL